MCLPSQPTPFDATAPRAVFLAPVEPWARENGSSVVIADLLAGLLSHDRVAVFPVFLRPSPAGEAIRGTPLSRPLIVRAHSLPKWFSVLAAVMTGRSPWQTRIPNRSIAHSIADAMRAAGFHPSVVHVEHLPLLSIGRHLASWFECPLVYRSHNIESQLWRRRVGRRGPVAEWLLRRGERQEIHASEESQLTLCISDVDVAWIRERSSAAVELLPPSVLLRRYEGLLTEKPREQQICFVGGLDWGPNETGLRWFVDRVLPLVQQSVRDVRLVVLARGASERPWLAQNPLVRVTNADQSAPELFAASRVSIAPLLEGGGVRIKILESLAVGCPVVATLIGGEGLELDGLTRTDEPGAFAVACAQHLRADLGLAERRALSEGIRARHGALEVAARLVDYWQDVASSASPKASNV